MLWRRIALFLFCFLILCGGVVLFPAIDLGASAAFYQPGQGFPLGASPLLHAIHERMPWLVAAIVLYAAVLLALRRWRAGLFVLLALAVGPGLVVNVLFKDHWGRARPAQIEAFGGAAHFSRAFVPSDQCRSNCSFPAGDPANGFVLASAGLLASRPRRRRALIAASVGLGLFLGFVRMAQGGHFLSDVIASGFLVFATTWALYRSIVLNDGLSALVRALRHPSPALKRFAFWLVASAAGVLAAYFWLDRPLARLFAGTHGGVASLFRVITEFGVTTPYLVAAALIAALFAVAAKGARDRERKRAFELAAWKSGFVFAVVAGAGLAGDLMKPFFGRARPRLYLSDGIFGFTWHGGRAAYWSFPSGHAITVVALAAALASLDRRWRAPAFALALLVVASRLVLAQHYLSDVIAGAFLAGTTCWAVQAAFRRAGIALNSP
jgi:lipid A 4'-phosphatase